MHDCSEGGMGVALAEMAFAGELGIDIFLSEVPYSGEKRNDSILFSESASRFIVEVGKEDRKEFEKTLKGIPYGLIGCLKSGKDFLVYGLDGNLCIKSTISKLKQAWKEPLKW
jgi:phosphoribosylformylglycinamidine synthase